MAEVVERLVATLEADIRGFTKNMAEAQRQFDARSAQIERRQTAMMGRLNSGFNSGGIALGGLIARYTTWGAVILATRRILQSAAEQNDDVSASVDRLSALYDRFISTTAPYVAAALETIAAAGEGAADAFARMNAEGQKAVATLMKAQGGVPGINIAMGVSPLQPGYNVSSSFDKKSGNWTPSPGGFPTPGVTDITPPKAAGNNFDRMYNESMNQLAGQLYDQFQRDRETAAKESADIFLEGQRIRSESARNPLSGFTTQEQEALDQFHAEALEAWDRYYEGVADLADRAATIEQERVADRIAEIGAAFEYLGHAALQGGEAFERALANMAASLALSGLRNILEAGLTSIVGGGGFFGNLISGARAGGGPVSGGQTYLVGEKGPELFTPGSSGMIIPNAAMSSGGGSMVLNMPIDARGAQAGVAEQIARVAPAIVAAAVQQSNRNFKSNMIRTQRNQM